MHACPDTHTATLPSALAFWALFHCRHARPPDTSLLRWSTPMDDAHLCASARRRLRACL